MKSTIQKMHDYTFCFNYWPPAANTNSGIGKTTSMNYGTLYEIIEICGYINVPLLFQQ